jgi:CheY-like chemotaxis protein/HD-like signal output (HDOD) protein
MARILLVDPSETARRALQGILARGEHRFAAVAQPGEAWTFLRRNPGVDLLITGLQLEGGGNGLALVKKLRADSCLQHLPVVVYTGHGDRDSVRLAVNLHVQNFLAKPYHDDDIFAEIDKAEANPWRDRFFEEEKSFCRLMKLTPEALHTQLTTVHTALVAARAPLGRCQELADWRAAADLTAPLRRQAEDTGVWAVVDVLTQMTDHASTGRWSLWAADLEALDYATLLLAGRLDPVRAASPGFYAEADPAAETELRARAVWLAAPAEGRCPVIPWEQLQREVEALPGCPVIDSAAAAFQMAANGHPSCINPLMDLVARDPGLSVQMLIAANQAHPAAPGDNPIEDARLAVGQLGELRLEQQARGLAIVGEHALNLSPHFNWPRYWTFQRGVARIAQAICHDLEFYSLEPSARVAGQLHDIGRLILAHLHPTGFQAILEYARVKNVRLHEAEKLFLGCTGNHLGVHFAEKFGLSRRFVNVMRGIDDPAAITDDIQLAAIISLARKLCRQNGVGASGDPVLDSAKPIAETAQWRVLSEGLYPSFELKKFEAEIHAQCDRLRTEFSGHQAGTVGDLVAHAVG